MSQVIKYEDYAVIRAHSPTYGTIDYKIDLEDAERCSKHVWSILKVNLKQSRDYFYLLKQDDDKNVMLHRFLMNASDDCVVDHINFDTTDSRKINLRSCSFQANCRNRRLSCNNTSGYNGVSWCKKNKKWIAYIHVNNKYKNLGYHSEIEDAVAARRKGEMKYFGDYITELKMLKEQAPKIV